VKKRPPTRRTVSGFGLVHVLTGDGRGKTTSAVGLAMRAWGQGARVAVVQFLKRAAKGRQGQAATGEARAASKLGKRFRLLSLGAGFVRAGGRERHARAAASAVALAERLARSGEVDMLVLDEILVAAAEGLVTRADLERLLEAGAGRVELVLTGRGAPSWLKGRADYWTEMREVRHPFPRGVRARRGVEF
jgi:cob(I)alamin adenosyltransferase